MPFGLCNTPETFQCLMMFVLVGLHWTMCLTGTPFSYMRSYSKAKGRKWYWNEDCETSFQNLKMCLATTPVLCFPKPFLMDVDPSGGRLGAILN